MRSITYSNDREISGLVIHNDKGQTVYELKAKADTVSRKEKAVTKEKTENSQQKQESQKEYSTTEGISKEQMASLQSELKRTGVAMEAVQERYKITAPESMNEKTYKRVMEALSKTKAA